MIDFDSMMPCIYWDIQARLEYLQRRVLVHSILYYEMDSSVVSDKDFDALSKMVVLHKTKYPNVYQQSRYYYCFGDFDGSTGFDLYGRLNAKDKKQLQSIAVNVLNSYNGKEV